MKVYLPRWTRWILAPVFLLIWSMLTYGAFAAPPGADRVPPLVWALVTLLLLLIATMLWLMTSGRLPAYEIEEIDQDRKDA